MTIYAFLIQPGAAGSGYNARTGNNVSICPGGSKKAKKPQKNYMLTHGILFYLGKRNNLM